MSKIDLVQPNELIQSIKNVKLVGFPDIKVYENASVNLETIDIKDIYPSAFYLLADHLQSIKLMYKHLRFQGVDIFRLTNIFINQNYFILPPVLEVVEGKYTLVDGQHRIHIAQTFGIKKINALIIRDVSAPLPVMPIDWEDVGVYETIPVKKRMYNPVIETGKHSLYYRALPGSSGERKRV